VANFHLDTTVVPTGLSVIEASAGTGKTWTIAHLLPRLLVDGIVDDIGQVLLVTFTKDAARELGERTRRQLSILVAHADAGTDPGADEEGVRILLDRLAALDTSKRETAVLRLRLAIDESDQLAVSTIHSFCQQVLVSESFLCGIPAGFEVIPNPGELESDAVRDTWRTDLAADALLASVAALGKWSVEKDLAAWRQLNQRPSTRMEPAPPLLREARNKVVTTLEVEKQVLSDLGQIQEIAARNAVRLTKSGEESVPQLDAWHALLDAMDPQQPSVEAFQAATRLAGAASWFNRSSAAGKIASHEAGALPIVTAAKDLEASIDVTGWAWLAHLNQAAGQRLERSLRHHNAVTSDGLIQQLHRALCSGPNRTALAQRLSTKWTVGLIDESQDINLQQLDIFTAIFDRGTNPGRLILVGDPKQAIYSFRGGDLDAYLSARPTDDARVSDLATTYRSAHGLVLALNTLFGRTRAFGNPALLYPAATAARQDTDLPLPADGQGRLVAWVVPDEDRGAWKLAQPRRELAAGCTATAIVDLLGRPMGAAGDAVNPSHVAVLTRTNLEARLVYDALRARGVPTVIRDDGDVMQSETASDLSSILKAVLSPTHPGWRRAAMATRLLGYDSTMLAALSGVDAEDRLASFSAWGELWRRRGIAAMMAGLESNFEVSLRLAQAPSGERRLTDLRHLVDLLQTREADGQPTPEKLLQWFEGERMSEESSSEERLRRLEEDGDAVQVVTVHRAKGLEFDFVYCPYLWSSVKTNHKTSKRERLLVRNADSWVLADGAQRDNSAEYRAATAERLLEDLRVTYVALTRARRRVTLLAGSLGHGLSPTALDWLLRTDEHIDSLEDWYSDTDIRKRSASGCEHGDTLYRLQVTCPDAITVSPPPSPAGTAWTGANTGKTPLHARPAPTLDLQAWHLTSFSRLAHGRHEERERRDAPIETPTQATDNALVEGTIQSDDTGNIVGRNVISQTNEAGPTMPLMEIDVPMVAFARGAHTGNCLHEMLEQWDFQEGTSALVERGLHRHRLYSDAAVTALTQTLDNLKTTHLTSLNANLQTAASNTGLSEWEFLLPLGRAGITGPALSDMFAKHARNDDENRYALDLTGLPGQALSGMLTGYIDRLVRAGDHWAVVDWKSNYLGPRYADYSRHAMWQCATDQHYVLQIHLYLVALRRYLRLYTSVAPAASGCLLFVRGVLPRTSHGVLEITPPEGLLDDLDSLFVSTNRGEVA